MRDCEKCKHRVMKVEIGKGTSPEHFWGCECWECEFEPTTKNDLGVDAISRADARSLICKIDIKHRMLGMSRKVFKELYNGMDELPSVTPQELKWIPVSERLPEKDMACLVAVGKFNFTQIAVYSDLMGIIDHRIFYQGDVGHDSFKNITKYVKAWMPLPPCYEPQERE